MHGRGRSLLVHWGVCFLHYYNELYPLQPIIMFACDKSDGVCYIHSLPPWNFNPLSSFPKMTFHSPRKHWHPVMPDSWTQTVVLELDSWDKNQSLSTLEWGGVGVDAQPATVSWQDSHQSSILTLLKQNKILLLAYSCLLCYLVVCDYCDVSRVSVTWR